MKTDRQHQTSRMSQHETEQLSLLEQSTRRIPLDFSLDDVRRLKSESHALLFSVRVSGYDPKEIPLLLGIDAGQWSCIKDGKKHFPHDRRNEFMDVVGNEVLLMYACESRGYNFATLRRHQSELEAENSALKGRIAELEREQQVIAKFIGEMRK